MKILNDYNLDYRNTILLAGIARSGTTWVADLINYNNEYRYINEPFYKLSESYCRGKFSWYKYIRTENKDKELIEIAQAILSGQVKDISIDYFNIRNRKFFADRRLIKEICANLFLKWIKVNFPEIPIVLLLRHPLAVANSRLNVWGSNSYFSTANFLETQKELVEDFLDPFKDEIAKVQDLFEWYIFRWCIKYYVPLKQFNTNEVHLAFYENFCENPQQEIDRMFNYLGKDYDGKIFSKLKSPSASTRQDSSIKTGGSLIGSWKNNITEEQEKRAIEILNLFGLGGIYSHDLMPNLDNAYSLLNKNNFLK